MAEALVEWLWDETHILKVLGSNSGTIFIFCTNCNDFLKRDVY